MPNETPRQLYIARFVMKSGATFDVVTDKTRDDIVALLEAGPTKHRWVLVPGENPEKQWPVDLLLQDNEIDAFFHGPYQVYLASRPNLSIS